GLLLPPVRENVFPLNVDVHNLRITLDALADWDDELADKYRQSPFSEEVRVAALLTGFKLPIINTFDEKTDPQDHMDHFSDLIELHRVDDLTLCRCFAVTLTGAAKKWFRGLKSELAKANNLPEGGVLTLMMAG
ncbi:hypothetical protein PanWU01x14_262310, partial [Parasponia andersonii]